MLLESRQLDAGDYTLLSIGNMFLDCADRALIIASAVPMVQPTAMVVTTDKKALVATLHKDNCTTSLRVVDPYTDPGVWAIVDEGCNSCTHSDAWRENAEKKWNKLGFNSYLKSSAITKFSGVGTAPSSGKWKLPCAIKLKKSELILPGALDSHEIADTRHPLLLSQGFQAKLGFTKSTRRGTITLDDYQGQEIEVVRQVKTGLFIIRIDHLFAEQYSALNPELQQFAFQATAVKRSFRGERLRPRGSRVRRHAVSEKITKELHSFRTQEDLFRLLAGRHSHRVVRIKQLRICELRQPTKQKVHRVE